MDLGLSILSCLGCNTEFSDMCGCLCVISYSQAALHGDPLRHYQAWSISHLVSKHGQERTLCRAATTATATAAAAAAINMQ